MTSSEGRVGGRAARWTAPPAAAAAADGPAATATATDGPAGAETFVDPGGNDGRRLVYWYTQTEDTVRVVVPVRRGHDAGPLRRGDVSVAVAADRIVAGLRDAEPLVQGELFEQVSVDDSLWTLETVEGVPSIVLTLEKALQPCYWPRLFKHASPQANPAEAETGMALYYESRGMYKEALDAYLRASEAGSVPAQLKLAAIYAVGDKGSPFPVAMDTEASFRWHLKAAEAGHGEAMFFVANSYQFEHGCPRDYKEAAKWYERSLEQFEKYRDRATEDADAVANFATMVGYSTTAMFNLGLLYHLGGDGLQPDPAKALRWWNLADAAGSAQAAYNLAVLYLTGKHVKQDIPKAMKLFKRAEERDRRLVAPDEQTARATAAQAAAAAVAAAEVPKADTPKAETPEAPTPDKPAAPAAGRKRASVAGLHRVPTPMPKGDSSGSPKGAARNGTVKKATAAGEAVAQRASATVEYALLGVAAAVAVGLYVWTRVARS